MLKEERGFSVTKAETENDYQERKRKNNNYSRSDYVAHGGVSFLGYGEWETFEPFYYDGELKGIVIGIHGD